MENRIRIREAIKHAKTLGKKINKRHLAGKVFGYRSEDSAYVSFNNYERGRSVKMSPDQIRILCKELGCTPNQLLGWEPFESVE